jgi:membrane protease YdiL (CAAX protease family)
MNIINPAFGGRVAVADNSLIIAKTNLFLLFILLLVVICGFIFEQRVFLGTIILESLILMITLAWIGVQGTGYRETLRLKIPTVKEIGLTLVVVCAGIYVASFAEQLFRFCIQNRGPIMEYNIPRPQNILQFISTITVAAILPALAEEALFRGFILKNYQKYLNTGKAIFISALLFGIAHLDISNFWGPLIMGVFYGWLVCFFDSIILGVIGHLLNNGITVTLLYLTPKLESQEMVTAKDVITGIPPFMIAGFILLVFFLRYQSNDKENKNKPGKLRIVLGHWSTGLLMIVFSVIAVIQFIMM